MGDPDFSWAEKIVFVLAIVMFFCFMGFVFGSHHSVAWKIENAAGTEQQEKPSPRDRVSDNQEQPAAAARRSPSPPLQEAARGYGQHTDEASQDLTQIFGREILLWQLWILICVVLLGICFRLLPRADLAKEGQFFLGLLGVMILVPYVVFTGEQAAATRRAVVAATEQVKIARETLATSERAWVAPLRVFHDTGVKAGEDFPFEIEYQNTGKEPALDVADKFIGEMLPVPETISTLGWDSLVVPPNTTCDDLDPIKGHWVIHPSTPYRRFLSAAGSKIDGAVQNGTKFMYVQGCFVYRTFGQRHTSSYCFFLEPNLKIPSKDWQFKLCPGTDHSYAD